MYLIGWIALARNNIFWLGKKHLVAGYNLENISNYSMRANFNHNFPVPENDIFEISKYIFSDIYFPIILKLDIIVLRVN